jgi:hypothetical protein
MAGEDRARSTDLDEASATQSARADSVALGLIAAPEIPEKIARELAAELPGLLEKHVAGNVSWDVSVVVDPLTGTGREAPELLDACHERLRQEGWDLAVCLTDLPVYREGRLIAADASAARRVACLSLPALGATRLGPWAREAAVQLVAELYAKIREPGEEEPSPDGEKTESRAGAGSARLPGPHPRRLVRPRPVGLVAPFRRIEPPDEDMKDMGVDARFVSPGARGHLRLWAGMVLANRPWKILPSFKGALAAAFATGAYALVIPTIWMLADAVGSARLLLLMASATTAMVVWIIVAHHLWERTNDQEARHWTALYNGVTVLTITTAVLLAYTVLFMLVLLAAAVFVPGAYFQSTLKHPVGPTDYATLAWLGTSLATVAGAIGSSLEHEDTVREVAYGYRQKRRNEKYASEDDSDAQ